MPGTVEIFSGDEAAAVERELHPLARMTKQVAKNSEMSSCRREVISLGFNLVSVLFGNFLYRRDACIYDFVHT